MRIPSGIYNLIARNPFTPSSVAPSAPLSAKPSFPSATNALAQSTSSSHIHTKRRASDSASKKSQALLVHDDDQETSCNGAQRHVCPDSSSCTCLAGGKRARLLSANFNCSAQNVGGAAINFSKVLPDEVVIDILKYLHVPALFQIAACSRQFYSLCADNALWKSKYVNHCNWSMPTAQPMKPSSGLCRSSSGNQQSRRTSKSSNSNQRQRQRHSFSLSHQKRSHQHASMPSPPSSPDSEEHAQDSMHSCSSSSTSCGLSSSSLASQVEEQSSSTPWKYHFRNRQQLDANWFGKSSPAIRTLSGHTDSVYCIQFDREKVVSGSRDKTVKIWDIATGRTTHTLTGHTGSVLCLQYDEKILVTGSSDGTLIVWSMENARQAFVLREHSSGVLDVTFNEKYIVSCSKDATIKVWDRFPSDSDSPMVDGIQQPVLIHTLTGHRAAVNAIQVRGNTLISASGDYLLKVWDLPTGTYVRDLVGHARGIACVTFDGRVVVSGSNDQTIRLWDVTTGQCFRVIHGHTDLVRTLAFDSQRALVVSGSYDQSVRVWNVASDLAQVMDGNNKPAYPYAAAVTAAAADDDQDHDFGATLNQAHRAILRSADSAGSVASAGSSGHGMVAPHLLANSTVETLAAVANATLNTPAARRQAQVVGTAAAVATAPIVEEDPTIVTRQRELHAFTQNHTSWVFNVALSATHMVSASQDQTIIVYDWTRNVDTRWIV